MICCSNFSRSSTLYITISHSNFELNGGTYLAKLPLCIFLKQIRCQSRDSRWSDFFCFDLIQFFRAKVQKIDSRNLSQSSYFMYLKSRLCIVHILKKDIYYVSNRNFKILIFQNCSFPSLSLEADAAVSFSLLISSELFSWGGQINLASKDKSVNRQVLSSTAIYIFLYYALRSFYDNVFKAIFMLRKLSNFVKILEVYNVQKY